VVTSDACLNQTSAVCLASTSDGLFLHLLRLISHYVRTCSLE